MQVKVGSDSAILIYIEEAAVMTFPPQVNLLSYIPDMPISTELAEHVEQLMSIRK